ncbi:MAG: zinc-binding dehydrogenase [Polymorphobacter sp.]|uniref:zinc-binding dehydrogenase n=1 Tax=Polymorphobacter sp. TaxID=1909290 RepID=UPI003A8C6CFE
MSETYRAIRLERFADTFRAATEIIEVPLTAPGPGEIRVRNRWCGINGIFDTQIARNAVDYVHVALPSFMGVEAIGVVDAVGPGVTGFKVGDAAATVNFRGGYREANVGPESLFARVPEASREWLALASTGVSALLALEHIGAVKDGETVAISAAAGGLGHLLVQLAKHRGCHVVAICGGLEKAAFVASLGADRVIDYKAEDVAAVLAAEYPARLDVAIDTVSGSIFDAFLGQMARHGRLVVGGAAQDLEGKPEIVTGPRIVHAIYYKGVSVRGFMNGLLTGHWPAARERVFALYRAGHIAVTFDKTRFTGLTGIYDGVERLLSGQSMGKVVVKIAEEGDTRWR